MIFERFFSTPASVNKVEITVPNPYLVAEATAGLREEVELLIEKLRTQRLRDLGLIEKRLESDLADFVLIAANVCNTAIAAINLVDDALVWVKAQNPSNVVPEVISRHESACQFTILNPHDVTIIPDTIIDERVKDFPLVLSNQMRFYAGAPVLTPDGFALGAICVWDATRPRNLDENQRNVLAALGRVIGSLLVRLR